VGQRSIKRENGSVPLKNTAFEHKGETEGVKAENRERFAETAKYFRDVEGSTCSRNGRGNRYHTGRWLTGFETRMLEKPE